MVHIVKELPALDVACAAAACMLSCKLLTALEHIVVNHQLQEQHKGQETVMKEAELIVWLNKEVADDDTDTCNECIEGWGWLTR
jgi:hypothetical protein